MTFYIKSTNPLTKRISSRLTDMKIIRCSSILNLSQPTTCQTISDSQWEDFFIPVHLLQTMSLYPKWVRCMTGGDMRRAVKHSKDPVSSRCKRRTAFLKFRLRTFETPCCLWSRDTDKESSKREEGRQERRNIGAYHQKEMLAKMLRIRKC